MKKNEKNGLMPWRKEIAAFENISKTGNQVLDTILGS